MKIFPIALVFAAALALPTAAQTFGSVNRDAPTNSSSVEFAGGAKAELSHKSLNFAEGRFMERIKDARFRNMVNNHATSNPNGSFTLPAAMMMGGKRVEAGTYGLHFLGNDDGNWMLTLSHKDGDEVKLIQWELSFEKMKKSRKRLSLVLMAGDDAGSANLMLHFGNMAAEVAITPAKADK